MSATHPLKKILSKRVTTIVLILALFYVIAGIGHNVLKYRNYQKSFAEHKADIDQLTQDNLQLSELLTFLDTDEAVDAYARTRLGLQQEGERAFIITENGLEATVRVDDLAQPREPNMHKWLRYFFY